MNIQVPDQSGVISAYGYDAQAMIHMEECAELIQAASKMRRRTHRIGGSIDPYRTDEEAKAYENLVEEMADVCICLEQMRSMYGIYEAELQEMVNRKCRRQQARLEEIPDRGLEAVHDVNV